MFSLSTGSAARYYKSTPIKIYPININKCTLTEAPSYLWSTTDSAYTITNAANQILNIDAGALSVGPHVFTLAITIGTKTVSEVTTILL